MNIVIIPTRIDSSRLPGKAGLENIFGECYSCSTHVKFWEKMIDEFDGSEIAILPNRKYYNGKYYNSMYFNFNKKSCYIIT